MPRKHIEWVKKGYLFPEANLSSSYSANIWNIFLNNFEKNDSNIPSITLSLNVLEVVAFSINLRTKCVFLVMFKPPLPPCTHLYALVLTPPPPLAAYVINGRPLMINFYE